MTVERISFLTRLNNSVNGNPRFRVTFEGNGKTGADWVGGHSAITTSDAGFCYGLENRENFDRDVEVTYTRAGRISGIRPI